MALADTARLIASLELKDLFSKQIGNAEKSLGKFDTKLDATQSRAFRAGQQIGHGIQNTARVIATAAIAVGTISAGVVAKGIAAASDLSETVSKVGVVFKQQAASVLAFGKTSAAALGLSENAALSAAATYGNLFVSMGLASDKSAKMSIALVKLAGDLASFNNIDPAEALEKLRAGLTGESEPLKTLGININEQTLKAKALELGLVKLTKGQKTYTAVLDPATKAQAAYALIFEQSKTAQGDFGRTSSGLANQIRILKANFTDMLATIGSPVLPQVAKVFQRINALVKENQPQVAKFGQAVADLFTDENLDKGVEILKGAVNTFKAAAPLLEASAKATLGFIQAAVGVFKSLPAPLQAVLAGGFALNKLTGGLVTNFAGGLFDTVKDLILKQRGTTPLNPLFVADVTGGIGGLAGKAVGAAGAAGGLGLFGGAGLPLAVIGASIIGPLIAQQKISADNTDLAKSVGDAVNKQIAGGATLNDLKTSLAAVNTGIDQLQSNPLYVLVQGDALDELKSQRKTLETALYFQTHPVAAGNATPKTFIGSDQFPGKEKDDRDIVRATLKLMVNEFKNLNHTLRTSNKPSEIKNAIAEAMKLIGGGRGNAKTTEDVLASLKTALKNTHDPKLQESLRAAIGKVERVLPGRQFAAKQLAKADAVLRSSESSGRKIRDLQAIEKSLRDRGLPAAAKSIGAKVEAAKRDQIYAIHDTTQQIKDKDMSPKITIPITNRISVGDIVKTQTTFAKFGKYQS